MLNGLIQILIPTICSTVLLFSILINYHIFLELNYKSYRTLSIVSILAFLVTVTDFIINKSIFYNHIPLASNTYVVHNIVLVIFTASFPKLFKDIFHFNGKINTFNRAAGKIAIVLALAFTVFCLVYPESLSSIIISKNNINGINSDIKFSVLFVFRNIILFTIIIYCTVLCIILNKVTLYKYRSRMIFSGLIIFTVFTVSDIFFVYFNKYLIFNGLHFSRLNIGITVFIITLATACTKEFVEKVKLLSDTTESLKQSEVRFMQITMAINEIVWISNFPITKVHFVNSMFRKIYGLDEFMIYQNPDCWKDIIFEEDKQMVLETFIENSLFDVTELEYRIIRDNDIFWVRDKIFPVKDNTGKIFRIVRIIEDITQRKISEKELSYLAYHDVLTGLFNRKGFYENFTDIIYQSTRQKVFSTKALLFIDLDNFKAVNDTFGHHIGDQLLKIVSERIIHTVRSSDHVYRLGGDEFSVILTTITNILDAATVATKLIESVSAPYHIGDENIYIGISIGISLYPRDGIDFETLFRNSDIALVEAKKFSNSYSFYDTEMNIQATDRMTLDKNMRLAIDHNEFEMYYQPLVNRHKAIIGAEALIRWYRPDVGFISPDKFIPLAENNGLILQIGKWVLETALTQLDELHKEGFNIRFAINISPKQFKDKDFMVIVENICNSISVPLTYVEFEITEGCMMEDTQESIKRMNYLNQKGISFSLDDFGTGYSSLSYMKKFPITHLKIDKSFITGLDNDENNQKITRAIIGMSHGLGIKVISEGVETEKEYDILNIWKCDEYQGYYFSKPISFGSFKELLKKGIQ